MPVMQELSKVTQQCSGSLLGLPSHAHSGTEPEGVSRPSWSLTQPPGLPSPGLWVLRCCVERWALLGFLWEFSQQLGGIPLIA